MCSERINPVTLNFHLNIRCLYPLTILFQENIYTEYVQLGERLQGDWVGKSFSLPADLFIALC